MQKLILPDTKNNPCQIYIKLKNIKYIIVSVHTDYELTEFRVTALTAVRDRSEGTLSAGMALAFEKKFTFRSLRTRAFPAGVATFH